MIISFSVSNFGSIKEKQTFSFEADKSKHLEDYYVIQAPNGMRLLKLAMIHGANASGKTTLLKALDFLQRLVMEPADKKTDPIDFEPYLFDKTTPYLPSTISIEFLEGAIRYHYELTFSQKAIINESLDYYAPVKANVFRRETDLEVQISSITFGSKIRADKTLIKVLTGNTLWNVTVLGGFLKTNLEIPEVDGAVQWFAHYLRKIILPRTNLEGYISGKITDKEIRKSDVINILQQADLNISDIFIEEEEQALSEEFVENLKRRAGMSLPLAIDPPSNGKFSFIDISLEHTVNGIKYNLPLERESQGTRRYFGFAGLIALMMNSPTGFYIDELDSSLHPDLYRHFILTILLNVKQSQLLFTTHNRELLNDRDLFRDDAVWFTDKSDTPWTRLYRLSQFDSKVVRDTTNVFNAYKVGKLGGVPLLGDNFVDVGE